MATTNPPGILPHDADPHAAYVLAFIASHSHEECEAIFDSRDFEVFSNNLSGTITLDAKEDPKDTEFTIALKLPANQKEQLINKSKLKGVNDRTKFHSLKGVEGKLYRAPGDKNFPSGKNICWIQQYPTGKDGNPVYRTVIEFYTKKVITAVFKTAENDFGGYGEGDWEKKPKT